jgi:hypothetical protein
VVRAREIADSHGGRRTFQRNSTCVNQFANVDADRGQVLLDCTHMLLNCDYPVPEFADIICDTVDPGPDVAQVLKNEIFWLFRHVVSVAGA